MSTPDPKRSQLAQGLQAIARKIRSEANIANIAARPGQLGRLEALARWVDVAAVRVDESVAVLQANFQASLDNIDPRSATRKATRMSDPTPLAQRLVEAACKADPVAATARPSFVRARAEAVTAAVLRELVAQVRDECPAGKQDPGYDEGWADAYEQVSNDVETLADSIEKGGE